MPSSLEDKNIYKSVQVNRQWCKGCAICVYFCPKQVLQLDEKYKAVAVYPEKCIQCAMCERRCPDLAIELLDSRAEEEQPKEVVDG